MNELIERLVANLPTFTLAGFRVGGMLFLAPVFGQKSIPRVHRLWLTMLMTLIMMPVVQGAATKTLSGTVLVPMITRELAVGMLIGFTVTLVLASAAYAGRIAGVHVGFGLANVINPLDNEQGTLLDQLQGLVALLLFIGLGGHRMLIEALAASFQAIPLGAAVFESSIVDGVIVLFVRIAVVGLQIAVPVLIAVFLSEIAIGVISRGAPQFNLFSIGLPLRIIVGVLVFLASMPLFIHIMGGVIEEIPTLLSGLFLSMGTQ